MYAQKNYPQHLGNGQFTIAEAGCLLTAVCNGLEKLNGHAPDPPTLNEFYKQHGLFLHDPDGANEDLAWGSISQYDPTIVVQHVAQGSVPPSNNAIVKFHYNGVHTGQPIDHYCWVDHVEGNSVFIIDSWDGVVKGPDGYVGVYHQPIAYATFIKNVPVPAIPTPPPTPSTPPAAPVAIPGNTENVYTVIVDVPGYRTSGMAASRTGATTEVKPETYFVFNAHNGMVNVTRVPGIPGSWINPGDNVIAPPAPTEPVVPPAPPIAEPETPVDPPKPDWRTSYVVFRNKFGDPAPKYYIAMRDIPVPDLEQRHNDLTMHKYSVVAIGGTFTKDDVVYARPATAANKFMWYGIEMTDKSTGEPNLELESSVYDTSTDTHTRVAFKNTTLRDKLVLATASAEKAYGTIEGIFRRKKIKK